MESIVKIPSGNWSCILTGVSQSGKSKFLHKLLSTWHDVHPTPLKRLVIVRANDQRYWTQLAEQYGDDCRLLSDYDECHVDRSARAGVNVVVFDDVMERKSCVADILRLFSIGVHHLNVVCLVTMHSIYQQSTPSFRTITRCANVLVLFDNPRDARVYGTLSGQIYNDVRVVPNAIKLARHDHAAAHDGDNHFYLWIDLTLDTPLQYSLKYGIFADDHRSFVYALLDGR